MSKKDFELIASILKEAYHAASDGSSEWYIHRAKEDAIEDVAQRLAKVFLEVNSNFNKESFLIACDVI